MVETLYPAARQSSSVAVTKLLLDISLLGFHRLSTVLHQGVLQLPGMAKPDSDMCSRLQRFFGIRNLQMEWLDSGRKGTAFRDVLAKIRKGDEGQALVGSRVQLQTGKGGRWGTISSYCTNTRLYTVDMQDLTNVSLTHAKVLEYWMPPLSHSSWTREDQKYLGSQIRRIAGCRNVTVSRQLRTPHHTMLTSETWTASEKWYTCEMSVAFPTQYEDLFTKRRSHEMDLRIATKLCEDQVVFLGPQSGLELAINIPLQSGRLVCTGNVNARKREGGDNSGSQPAPGRAAPGRRDLDVI